MTTLPGGHARKRAFRPYALAVTLATLVISVTLASQNTVGDRLDNYFGVVVGGVGLAAVIFITAGWIAYSEALTARGLLLSAGVWVTVTTVTALERPWAFANWGIAACWALASGGSYLLERLRPREN